MKLTIDAWENGAAIPARYAFGKPGDDGPFATSDNVSPALRWENAPEGTRSFAIIVVDPDVPSSGEDVNQEGKTSPPTFRGSSSSTGSWLMYRRPSTRSKRVLAQEASPPKASQPGR